MQYKDYYEILGVKRDATLKDIKASYRKLAHRYHPDVSKEKDAAEKIKEINEAYEVLKDPEKRKAYDQLGSNWRAGQDFRPPPGWEDIFQQGRGGSHSQGGFQFNSGGGDFSDFFEKIFGGAMGGGFSSGQTRTRQTRTKRAAPKGEDIRSDITIALEEAASGTEQRVVLEAVSRDNFGRATRTPKHLNIKIPAGSTDGKQIRLKGQGQASPAGGENGDLYLTVHIAPHPLFRLEGQDLVLRCPVTPWEAALGAKITIPTLTGKGDIKVPAGAQSGKRLRLKGKGLSNKTGAGDLFVEIQIMTPPAEDPNMRTLYEKMAEIGYNPRQW